VRVLMVHPSPLLFSEIYLLTLRLLARGTNFFKMLWKFRQVYSAERLLDSEV
jgi:hypothetical protein